MRFPVLRERQRGERCPCAMTFVLFAALVVLGVGALVVLLYLLVRRWL
jgi:hypothetical protein